MTSTTCTYSPLQVGHYYCYYNTSKAFVYHFSEKKADLVASSCHSNSEREEQSTGAPVTKPKRVPKATAKATASQDGPPKKKRAVAAKSGANSEKADAVKAAQAAMSQAIIASVAPVQCKQCTLLEAKVDELQEELDNKIASLEAKRVQISTLLEREGIFKVR